MAKGVYKGRSVKLNKVQRGDVKKFKVFVRNKKTGRVQKVNFGAKGMSIGRNDPERRRSFFSRFRPIYNKAKRSGKQITLQPVHCAMFTWIKGFKL